MHICSAKELFNTRYGRLVELRIRDVFKAVPCNKKQVYIILINVFQGFYSSFFSKEKAVSAQIRRGK